MAKNAKALSIEFKKLDGLKTHKDEKFDKFMTSLSLGTDDEFKAWDSDATTHNAKISNVLMWKLLVKSINDQYATKFCSTDKPEPIEFTKHEVKCDKGHDLSKDQAFYCTECEKKYFPRSQLNYYIGKDICRENAILNNFTTSYMW